MAAKWRINLVIAVQTLLVHLLVEFPGDYQGVSVHRNLRVPSGYCVLDGMRTTTSKVVSSIGCIPASLHSFSVHLGFEKRAQLHKYQEIVPDLILFVFRLNGVGFEELL